MAKLDFILADTTIEATKCGLDFVMQKSRNNKFEDYVVIIPEDKTILAEKYLLSIAENGAFDNIYVYSFQRLLSKISKFNASKVLSRSASIMITRKVIIDNMKDFVCYKKSANTNGFAEVIFDTISQLKSSNVSVADFYEMISTVGLSLKIKMQDIALIYEKYQEYIENHYIDQSDVMYVLENSIENSEFVKNAQFYILGFDAITAQGLSVCEKIINSAKSTIVAASYMANSANSHISDNEVFTKFKHIADKIGANYNPQRFYGKYNKDFAHIKENLFAYPQKQTNGTNAVELYCTDSLEDEIYLIAEKIQKLIKNGAKYKEIGIIAPNIDKYLPYIDKIFTNNNFSYFVSKPYDYSLHPLFQLVKNTLEMIRKNYEKSTVINFLSNILVNCENLDNFINYIEKYGINYAKFKNKFTKYDEKIISEQEFLAIEEVRAKVQTYTSYFSKANSVKEFNISIRNLLENMNIQEKLDNLMAIQDSVNANITKQSLEKLSNCLNELDEFLGDEQLNVDMYENVLLSGLEVSDVSLIPISQDAINILSDSDGIGRTKYIFIVGATDGVFPRRKDDCGIILDNEMNELNDKYHKTIEPTIKTINKRERFKAYQTVLLATEKLYMSYSVGSGDEINTPSMIMKQLITMFGGEQYLSIQKYNSQFEFGTENIKEDVLNKISCTSQAEKYLCMQIGNFKTYGNYDNNMLTFAVYNELLQKSNDNINKILQNTQKYTNFNIKNAENLYFDNNKTSVSQLEKYFTCPFLFYANYGLRLKENETSDLRAMDIGNILHKVAEIFVKKFTANNSLNVKNTAKKLINDILNEEYVVDDNKFLSQIIYDESIRLCEKLADEITHSKFKPYAVEKTFGLNGAVKITDKVCLEGKIDRIDKYQDKFRIIDYKTGKIEDNLKLVYFGKKIQLISYLLAMKSSGLKPAGVVYYPIRNEYAADENNSSKMKGFLLDDVDTIMDMDTSLSQDNLSSKYVYAKLSNSKKDGLTINHRIGNYFSQEEFEIVCDYVEKLCKNAIDEILSGYIEPSPIKVSSSSHLPCEKCQFASICGVEKTNYKNGRKCYGSVNMKDINRSEV